MSNQSTKAEEYWPVPAPISRTVIPANGRRWRRIASRHSPSPSRGISRDSLNAAATCSSYGLSVTCCTHSRFAMSCLEAQGCREPLQLLHVRRIRREACEAGAGELAALPHVGQELLDVVERRPARLGHEHRHLARVEDVEIDGDVH